jgi:Choline dehydrogenase and related flavoproteins
MKKARVLKVLIDPNTKRVFGVEFMKNNKKRVVYAKKEVVLSAGAFFSPHLLLLSGNSLLFMKNLRAQVDV